MALDTAEKRRAAGSFWRLPGVTPNSSKDAEWRQQAARRYSGIAAQNAPDPPSIDKTFTINRTLDATFEV